MIPVPATEPKELPREYATLKCPYCDTVQGHYLKRQIGPQVVLCDIDDHPGCDRYFAVTLRMVPQVAYYTMEEDNA